MNRSRRRFQPRIVGGAAVPIPDDADHDAFDSYDPLGALPPAEVEQDAPYRAEWMEREAEQHRRRVRRRRVRETVFVFVGVAVLVAATTGLILWLV